MLDIPTYWKLRLRSDHPSPARYAIAIARTVAKWEAADGWIYEDGRRGRNAPPEPERSQGLVRLRIEPDEQPYDTGDMFTEAGWPEVSQAKRERAEKEFFEKLNRDGVWGIIAEYWDGERWQEADSCWGFDNIDGNVNDIVTQVDFMRSALDALKKLEHCPTCGRPKP